MKTAFGVIAVAAVLSMPATLFAQQSTESVTRDQVKADLLRLEQVGYQPASADDANYPNDIQAAEARVAGAAGETGMGGAQGGASQSGRQVQPGMTQPAPQQNGE